MRSDQRGRRQRQRPQQALDLDRRQDRDQATASARSARSRVRAHCHSAIAARPYVGGDEDVGDPGERDVDVEKGQRQQQPGVEHRLRARLRRRAGAGVERAAPAPQASATHGAFISDSSQRPSQRLVHTCSSGTVAGYCGCMSTKRSGSPAASHSCCAHEGRDAAELEPHPRLGRPLRPRVPGQQRPPARSPARGRRAAPRSARSSPRTRAQLRRRARRRSAEAVAQRSGAAARGRQQRARGPGERQQPPPAAAARPPAATRRCRRRQRAQDQRRRERAEQVAVAGGERARPRGRRRRRSARTSSVPASHGSASDERTASEITHDVAAPPGHGRCLIGCEGARPLVLLQHLVDRAAPAVAPDQRAAGAVVARRRCRAAAARGRRPAGVRRDRTVRLPGGDLVETVDVVRVAGRTPPARAATGCPTGTTPVRTSPAARRASPRISA